MYFGGICFITDRTISSLSVEDQVKMALDAGIQFIQYREKTLTRRDIYYNAETLRAITLEYKTTFIVNDHADIALAVDAEGVHLGQDDLPLADARKIMGEKIIGISTHDLKQATDAAQGGADYIGFGPVYHTTTKDAGTPRGPEEIALIRRHVRIPIVAIGGIGHENLEEVFNAGADAAAVASAILKNGDPYENAKKFVEEARRVRK